MTGGGGGSRPGAGGGRLAAMPVLRRSLPLLLGAALACTGRMDTPSAPAQAPGATGPAPAETGPAPADPGDALAATLTEEKLGRLLAFEDEILPTSAALVALASAPGAGGRRIAGELSLEERTRRLEGEITAALQKHGLTRADHAGFGALSSGIVQRSAAADAARAQIAADAEQQRKAAGAQRGKREPRPPPGTRDLREAQAGFVEHLKVEVAQADADRKAFAARHGDAALALLDRYRPRILAVREKQVRVVLEGSAAR